MTGAFYFLPAVAVVINIPVMANMPAMIIQPNWPSPMAKKITKEARLLPCHQIPFATNLDKHLGDFDQPSQTQLTTHQLS